MGRNLGYAAMSQGKPRATRGWKRQERILPWNIQREDNFISNFWTQTMRK